MQQAISDHVVDEELTEEQMIALEKAFSYAKQIQELYQVLAEKSRKKLPHRIINPSQNPTIPNITTIAGVAQIHAMSILCRIYIGSIYFELSESDIRKAFSPFGYIRVVSMTIDPTTGHHKGYCFLEYETPDAAYLALESMNGAILGGRSIKVGRSNNFPTELSSEYPLPIPQRLYVSNIHEAINESDLKEIFSSFGNVKHCTLVSDLLTHKHKHYGYVEFENEKVANLALNTMKDFQLGGQVLKIRKTVLGGELPMGMSMLNTK